MKKLILVPGLLKKKEIDHFYPNKRFFNNKKYLDKSNYFQYPYLSYQELLQYYSDCEKIYISLIESLKKNLNILHSINWSNRSWEIYLGHWLKKFIYINYNKYKLLEKIKETNKIKKIYINKYDKISLATIDTNGIDRASSCFDWESIIFARLTPIFFDEKKIIKIKKKIDFSEIYYNKNNNIIKKNNNSLKTKIIYNLFYFFNRFTSNLIRLSYFSLYTFINNIILFHIDSTCKFHVI